MPSLLTYEEIALWMENVCLAAVGMVTLGELHASGTGTAAAPARWHTNPTLPIRTTTEGQHASMTILETISCTQSPLRPKSMVIQPTRWYRF